MASYLATLTGISDGHPDLRYMKHCIKYKKQEDANNKARKNRQKFIRAVSFHVAVKRYLQNDKRFKLGKANVRLGQFKRSLKSLQTLPQGQLANTSDSENETWSASPTDTSVCQRFV